jgi:hypothetical protein
MTDEKVPNELAREVQNRVLAIRFRVDKAAAAVISAERERAEKAEAERDEFLAVLKALVEQTAQYGHDEEIADARAVITKAEKQL